MDSIKVPLLDSTNFNVQYGLNWGQRENRDPNQAYLQLEPDVYKSDFFPGKENTLSSKQTTMKL